MSDDRPNVGLFRKFGDAVHQAHFRASLVRRRYRVYYEPANRWWQIRETHDLLQGHRDFEESS